MFCPDKQHSFEPFMCEGCTDSLLSGGHTTLTGSDSATRQLCLLLKEQSDHETPFKASVELTLWVKVLSGKGPGRLTVLQTDVRLTLD